MLSFDRKAGRALEIATSSHPMKTTEKKQWTKPSIKTVRIFFECTCYAAAV